MAATIEEAVVAWWRVRTWLHPLVSDGRLWHVQSPEGTALPYATFDVITQPARLDRTTGYYHLDGEVEIAAHATTDSQASRIRKAIRDAIEAAVLQVEGGPSWACLPGDQWIGIAEGLGPDGTDCWRATVNVSITIQRNQ